jgi:hypothetical protein
MLEKCGGEERELGGQNLRGGTVKEIRNKTTEPIRIPLPGGKVLHLGPAKVAQIADNATEHAALQRLVKAGSIEILGEGERPEGGGDAGNVPEETHGHAKTTFHRGQGER